MGVSFAPRVAVTMGSELDHIVALRGRQPRLAGVTAACRLIARATV